MTGFNSFPIAKEILNSLSELGFAAPFPIQAAAIGPLLDGRDIIGQAKTGTGKTAAFGVPMVQKVDQSEDAVQGLVLVPTRELAQQVASDLCGFGKHLGIRTIAAYGGVPVYDQMEALQHTVHIVVGTPGRVIDLLSRGVLVFDKVAFLVLDEADRMLDMGFIDDIEYILRRTPESRQTAMFSATMPDTVLDLAARHMHAPEKLLISRDEVAVEEIQQFYQAVRPEQKVHVLQGILNGPGVDRALVFCGTKIGAARLGRTLMRLRDDVAIIHGDLTQEQRNRSLDEFRRGQVRVLVATDVASRGLDIEGITHVINYDVPRDPLDYFHRIGRTGRAGASGTAITLMSMDEAEDVRRIGMMTNTRMQEMKPFTSGERETGRGLTSIPHT